MARATAVVSLWVLCAAVPAAAQEVAGPREPVIQGRGLSAWALDLEAEDGGKRTQAAKALRMAGAPAATLAPQLIERLAKDELFPVREECAKALATSGVRTEASIAALTKGLSDATWQVRSACAAALTALDACEQAVAPLLKMVKEETAWYARMAAATGLSRGGEAAEAVLPELEALLGSDDRRDREVACYALGNFQGRAVGSAEALAAASRDGDWQVRRVACEALGHLGPEAVAVTRPALVARLTQDEERERLFGIIGLTHMARYDDGAVHALISALDDPAPANARFAAAQLAELGLRAAPALKRLEALAESGPEPVRAAARKAAAAIIREYPSGAPLRRPGE